MTPAELAEALAQYAWVHWHPTWSSSGGKHAELRCDVRMPALDELPAGATNGHMRAALFAQAEKIIDIVEQAGWRHVEAPVIEIGGDIGQHAPGRHHIVHACTVRMDIWEPTTE